MSHHNEIEVFYRGPLGWFWKRADDTKHAPVGPFTHAWKALMDAKMTFKTVVVTEGN